MLSPGSGMPRATRAAALAGLATLLAAGGHRLGGMSISGPAMLLALAVTLPLAWAVTGRRLRAGALVAILGGGQVLAHLSFVIAAGAAAAARASLPARAAGPPGPSAAPGPHGTHTPSGHPLPGGHGLSGHALDGHGGPDAALLGLDARMLLAHALATVVLAVLVARGEAILWRVWDRLRPHLPTAGVLPVPEPRRSPDRFGLLPRPALASTSRITRGPPGAGG